MSKLPANTYEITMTFIVTLPAVGLGGPVTVLNWNATTTGGTVYVVTADGSTIDGTSGTIGTTLAVVSPNYTSTAAANIGLRARQTFSSDGTNWWSQSGGPVVAGL